MSCCTRHSKGELAALGITMSPENRKAIDRAMHDHVGVEYKECSAAWSRVRVLPADEAAREAFLAAVAEAAES